MKPRLQSLLTSPDPKRATLLWVKSPVCFSGDLAVGQRDIGELDDTELDHLNWLVTERHRASIWLVGEYGPGYCDFPVDT